MDQQLDAKGMMRALGRCFKEIRTLDSKDGQSKPCDEAVQFTLVRFMPVIAIICLMLLVLFVNALVSRRFYWSVSKVAEELMWKNASVRPPLLLIIIVAGWAGVVWACRTAALNLEVVLGGPVQPPAATLLSALTLLAILLVSHVIHVLVSEIPGLTWRPWLTCNLILHVAFLSLGPLPLPLLQRDARSSLVRTLSQSIMAPLAPVTFWHVIVADYLTSLAKAFADMQMTFCISSHIFLEHESRSYVGTAKLWSTYHDHCANAYSNVVLLVLPFWCRLMQCLKVYSQTREQKNLWNALKYSTAFPLAYAGYMRSQEPSQWNKHFFIMAAVIQSSFTFVWDVLMDWGLPQRAIRGSSSCCGLTMRERLIVSRRKRVYFALCCGNFLLRFAWTLAVFGGVTSHGAGMFFFEAIEIARRTVWAIFRIEWEVVAKGIGATHIRLGSSDNAELGELVGLKISKGADS